MGGERDPRGAWVLAWGMRSACKRCGTYTENLSDGLCCRCCATEPPPPPTIEVTLRVRLPTSHERERGCANVLSTSEGALVVENRIDLARAARQLKGEALIRGRRDEREALLSEGRQRTDDGRSQTS